MVGIERDTETERRSIATGGPPRAEANTGGELPTGLKIEAHKAPLGLRDNLVSALKLLANQDGDSPMKSIKTGLHESSRRGIMDGFHRSRQSQCCGRG